MRSTSKRPIKITDRIYLIFFLAGKHVTDKDFGSLYKKKSKNYLARVRQFSPVRPRINSWFFRNPRAWLIILIYVYSPYSGALTYVYLSTSWTCFVLSRWHFSIGWCFTKITQFQERIFLRKLATKKKKEEKEQVIPNFNQFLALKHAAHLLDRLPSEGDKSRVFGPDCLGNFPSMRSHHVCMEGEKTQE